MSQALLLSSLKRALELLVSLVLEINKLSLISLLAECAVVHLFIVKMGLESELLIFIVAFSN